MSYVYRGITVADLIDKLANYDRETLVVLQDFDHSYEHRIDVAVEYAVNECGKLIEAESRYSDGAFKVVVIS